MQKVLITGAAGMLGTAIANRMFNDKNFEVYGSGRSNIQSSFTYIEADLLKEDELSRLLTLAQPDIIVHCAAIVNLNYCEANKEEAYKIHVAVTKKLASYNAGKCKFLYISTDSVFDGIKGNYSETAATAPLNYYALSKLQGEKAVASVNHSSLIIRTNIYGFNQNKNGNSLFEWIYKNLNDHQSISGFKDVLFNPLYTTQLAELVLMLINKNVTGIIHAGCEEQISKFQFALLIAEAFNFERSLVKAAPSNEMPSILQRPKNTTLNTCKLNNDIGKNYSIIDGINQLKADFIQQKNLHD